MVNSIDGYLTTGDNIPPKSTFKNPIIVDPINTNSDDDDDDKAATRILEWTEKQLSESLKQVPPTWFLDGVPGGPSATARPGDDNKNYKEAKKILEWRAKQLSKGLK